MIFELSDFAEHSGRVLTWLQSAWDDADNVFANTLAPSRDCPGTLIAISDGMPIGALTYRRHQAPTQATVELWINAVYVLPNHRRLGIGRKLIRFAVEHSIPTYTQRLFVFTDVPNLYDSLGWERIDYNAQFASFTMRFERKSFVSRESSEPIDSCESLS